jgi:Phage integrase, N-terminal SAM-like domain
MPDFHHLPNTRVIAMHPDFATQSGQITPGTLIEQLRGRIRVKHYSIRTEQAYVDWVRRFILFHGKRHPRDMGAKEVEALLTDLAVRRRVSTGCAQGAPVATLRRNCVLPLPLPVPDSYC